MPNKPSRPSKRLHLPADERIYLAAELRRLGYATYANYQHSYRWRRLQRTARRKACESCGSRWRLALHHATYARLGHEAPEDLWTLCPACHRRTHDRSRLTGSLVPAAVRREAREARRARSVPCPHCLVGRGRPCMLPSGAERVREHKARRQESSRVEGLRVREPN